MARTRISQFPAVYQQVIERVASEGVTLRVPTESREEAVRLRYNFYNYRRVLRKDSDEMGNVADAVLVTLEDNVVVFSNRDSHESGVAAMTQALEGGGDAEG